MTGVLNWDTFQTHALKFLEFSNKLQDSWKSVTKQGESSDEGSFFLERKCLLCSDETTEVTDEEFDDCSVTTDPSELQQVPRNEYLSATYHVVYSQSYQVPVLYFRITKPDGRPLTLEEIWSRIPVTYRSQLESMKWSMLTQQEHPVLGQPFNCLHPCHTEDLMKNWDNTEHRNYLVTWLSSVGPVVGLHLKPAYAQLLDFTS